MAAHARVREQTGKGGTAYRERREWEIGMWLMMGIIVLPMVILYAAARGAVLGIGEGYRHWRSYGKDLIG